MCNAKGHPGDCECGFGGFGHRGRRSRAAVATAREPVWRVWHAHEENFTRPTKCPVCKAEVFFVRHNGGSVWLDFLGGDWPKHGCFDTGPSYRRLRDRLALPTPGGMSYGLGVITEVFELVRMERARLVVRCSDGTLLNREFLTIASLEPLLGQMVIVTHRDDGSVTLTSAPVDEPQNGTTQSPNPMRWFIATSPGNLAPEQGRQG